MLRFGSLISLAAALSGCLDGDSQLNEELRALRAEVDASQRARAEMEAKLAAAAQAPSPAPSAPDAARMRALEDQVASLQRQLEEARSRAQTPAPASSALGPEGLKDLASRLQKDLMEKVTALSDQIQNQLPNTELEDVTVKRIKPPPEIESAFSSAITFTLKDASGRLIPVRFPVTAGLDGSWKVPTLEDVRAGMTGVLSAGTSFTASSPVAPGNPSAGSLENPAATASSGTSNGSFVRQPDGSILVNWDANAAPSTPAPAPGTPAPTASPPSVAAPPTPTVPAPVMPVERDIIIRFD